jgi:hypothetical protein
VACSDRNVLSDITDIATPLEITKAMARDWPFIVQRLRSSFRLMARMLPNNLGCW